jgi:hypothetical protein
MKVEEVTPELYDEVAHLFTLYRFVVAAVGHRVCAVKGAKK